MVAKLVLAPIIERYCNKIYRRSSRASYAMRINDFHEFLQSKYDTTIDQFVQSFKLNPPPFNVYDIMSDYNMSLFDKFQDNTIANRLSTARNFLEVNDVPIVDAKWKINVKKQKKGKLEKTPLETNQVRTIIIGLKHPRLRAFVHTLAATGCRSGELASVLVKHVNLEKGTMYFRREFTKTKQARTIYLTKELITELRSWVEYRKRVRTIVNGAGDNGKHTITKKPTTFKPDDLFFSTGRHDEIAEINPSYMRDTISNDFYEAMEQMGLGEMRELDDRHKVTFHTFRAFVKTTISNKGYQDFSEWFIGHAGSTYWSTHEKEKLKIFHELEPYLTYLDYSELEAHGATTEQELKDARLEIQELKEQIKQMQQQPDITERIELLEVSNVAQTQRFNEYIGGLMKAMETDPKSARDYTKQFWEHEWPKRMQRTREVLKNMKQRK